MRGIRFSQYEPSLPAFTNNPRVKFKTESGSSMSSDKQFVNSSLRNVLSSKNIDPDIMDGILYVYNKIPVDKQQ